MAVFRFEILGLKPRNFPEFESKKKSSLKSGFELYFTLTGKDKLSIKPKPKLNSADLNLHHTVKDLNTQT